MEKEQCESIPVEEFYAALDNIRCDLLASHLILMEEVRTLQEEMFDPDAESRRFIARRKTAMQLLMQDQKNSSEILARVLAKRR